MMKVSARIFWLVTLAALALILFSLPRSPLPWLDETFFVSTSLSISRGGPAVPTVMGAFPHTGRADLFYGPLGFFLGSIDLRIFGLSLTSWRLLGLLGAVGTIFSASWVSRLLDKSPVAMAASAMFVALSQGMGARATSGRLDTITTALELLSLACTFRAMQTQETRPSTFVNAALAGVLCGMAALSTPRAFPFVLGLFAAILLELVLARTWESVTRGLIIGAGALLPVWAWTVSQGTNPLGWFRFILAASRGDKVSVSPMLHGSWLLFDEPLVPLLSGFLVILVMLLVFGGSILAASRTIEGETREFSSGARLASVAVFINYVATFLTIARFWDYEIFVVPLVLPVLLALSAEILRTSVPRTLHRMILGSWLVLAIVLVAIRSGKVVAWLASYQERDPRPLQVFVSSKVPRDSRVFGPDDLYFYAVELAGSRYLFARHAIPSGLWSALDQGPNWREQLKEGKAVYLIWPSDRALPRDFASANLHLEGSFAVEPERNPVWRQQAAWGSGYPPTNLYRISGAQATEKDPITGWTQEHP